MRKCIISDQTRKAAEDAILSCAADIDTTPTAEQLNAIDECARVHTAIKSAQHISPLDWCKRTTI